MITHLPRRVAWSAALTAPVAAIEMSRHLAGWPAWHGSALSAWQIIMAIVATVVVFVPGWPLLTKGVLSYRRRKLNMFSLISLGVMITYLFSVLALVAPGLFPASFMMHGHVPVYFEAAAMITTLVLIGQWLEARAERHTGDALEALAHLAPSRASVIRDGAETWVPVDEIVAGDHIQLRAGDRIPVDGPVIRGEIAVDESMLTGEPLPALKRSGDALVGGSLIREGAAVMRAEQIGEQTVLARIIRMVKSAQESKAPIQRIADRVTGKLVPLVIGIAVLTFIIWWRIGPPPALWYALLHAVTVLMITCPCALGLATPVSIMTGLGRGALAGILVKHAGSLERLAAIDTIILDKTGTLTTGKPTLHACVPITPGQETLALKQAASLEQMSHHPLAQAIVEGAQRWGVKPGPVEEFRSETGGGVTGRIEGHAMIIGREDWVAARGVRGFEALGSMARNVEQQGHTVVWLARDGMVTAILVLSDELKPNAAQAIARLRDRGIKLLMMTGDNARAAGTIGKRLSLDEVYAQVKPGEKSGHVARLRAQGAVVAMVGDGINDAPALAAADVGLAIGTGTDVVVASGDINLMHGDIMNVVQAIDLSRATMRNIRQNLFFAFAYNAVMIPVAAGVLYPWTGWMLTPMLASVAMSASSITVITNALRLRRLPL